jgi:prepilin-type N-terminal cleavage/methylation domain-containing protein
MKTRRGFTLLEMLVVVVIIAILAGLVFYLIKGAGARMARAQTVVHVQKVRSALEEFFAEYGQYPPVQVYNTAADANIIDGAVVGEQLFRYEYATTNGLMAYALMGNGQWDVAYGRLKGTLKDNRDFPVFRFGLMSYLVPRYEGYAKNAYSTDFAELFTANTQWTNAASGNYVPDSGPDANKPMDQPRDRRACRRWEPILFDPNITYSDEQQRGPYDENSDALRTDLPFGAPSTWGYINYFITVRDGWNRDLHYRSVPPYESYDVWSAGPDGVSGNADDIH